MFTHAGWAYQRGGPYATAAQAAQILANQATILADIAAISTGGGDAKEAKQDQILAIISKPKIC